ncbi:transposase [Geoalkalibacter halelectricus]|uniref:transposase n=1 Tax=Geoalkalibacter halelectricus TaxID=2847045 RepID=UPI003D207EB9
MIFFPYPSAMPRSARIDIPGLLQHVIVRGIEKRSIFADDQDRSNFLKRLSNLLQETDTDCFAWALMDNHVHLLLRPRKATLGLFMRRLLTGYAVVFNLRHERSGHLFQNRYKSIVCDQDAYLLELIRYIHLNPLRAGTVQTLEELDAYPWCGHAYLIKDKWFNAELRNEILSHFASRPSTALNRYRDFLAAGLAAAEPADLMGGGKRRTLALDPALDQDEDFDDRILGGGAFVRQLLGDEEREERSRSHLNLDHIIEKVSRHFGVDPDSLALPNKERRIAQSKALICYLALRRFGHKGTEIAERLDLTPSGVSVAAKRGEHLFQDDDDLRNLWDNK